MAVEVASAYVTVMPSFRGFRRELLKEVRTAEKGVKAHIDVDVDRNRFQRNFFAAVTSSGQAFVKAGTQAGEHFSGAFARALTHPAVLAGIGLMVARYMPAIGAMAGGLFVTALGAAIAGLGIYFASQSETVRKSWGSLADYILQRMRELAKPWEEVLVHIRDYALQVFNFLAPAIGTAFEKIAPVFDTFAKNFARALERLEPVIGAVSDAFVAVLEDLGPELPKIFEGLADSLVNLANAVKDNPEAFTSLINGLFKVIGAVVDFLTLLTQIDQWMKEHSWLVAAFDVLWDAVFQPGENAKKVANLIATYWNDIKQTAADVWGSITSTVSGAWNAIKNTAIAVGSAVTSAISAAWNAVKSVTTSVWTSITSFLSSVWNSVKSTASSVWDSIKSAVERPVRNMVNTVTNMWNSLKSAVTSALNSTYNSAKSIGSKFTSIGRDIVNGIVRGVKNAAGALYNALKNLANNALSAAKKALGIKSPSRVFANIIGTQIPAGIAMGIDRNVSAATDAVRNLAASTAAAYRPPALASVGGGIAAPAGRVGGNTTVNLYRTDADPNVLAARLDWLARGRG